MHLGATGVRVVHTERNGGGGGCIAEEKQVKLLIVRYGDGRVITLTPHRDIPQDSYDIDLGSVHRWRGTGDINGIVTT